MAQIVPVGIAAEVQGGLYGGVSPITYEEGGTNGFGVRMLSVRRYRNYFTQPFTGGSIESGFFDSGHQMVVSVSNPTISPGPSTFTHKKLAAGTYQTDVDAMFDRMAALTFDAAVAGGSTFGGLKQPNIIFIYNHEQDAKGPDGTVGKLYYSGGWTKAGGGVGTKDTAADFVAAWKYLWGRWQVRAAAAGVPTSRVQFCWCMTAFGTVPDRVTQYWPGGQYVDIIGMDIYLSVGTSFSSDKYAQGARSYGIAKNKPVGVPEFNCTDGTTTDTSARASGITSAATSIANDTQCTWAFVNFWPAPETGSLAYMNFPKVAGASTIAGRARPLVHAGVGTFISTLGNNPIRSAVTQGLPGVATGVAVASSTDGKSATMTWAAPPGGDNVTGWDVYLAPGNTDVLVKKNTTPIAVTPRSYTFTGLTPGTQYSADAVAINSAGRSGYGTIATFTTSTPGTVNHAPNIASFTANPEAANPLAVDYNITATDPDGNPITITVTVTAPSVGFSETFTMTSGVQTTRSYTTPGAYTAVASVSDGSLTTTASKTFGITVSGVITPGQGWDTSGLQPNTDPRGVARTVLGIVQDLDPKLTAVQLAKSPHNLIHGLVASTFDPASIGGSTVYTAASGNLIWAALALQDLNISGITLITGTAQGGTGTQLGIHDSAGGLLTDQAGNLCSYGTTSAQTSVAVDGWLQTAFTSPTQPPQLTLPSSIDGNPGTVVYVSLFFPAGLGTYPTIRASSTGAVESTINLSQPRYGLATGQTAIVDPIPFASWTASSSPVWIGLF